MQGHFGQCIAEKRDVEANKQFFQTSVFHLRAIFQNIVLEIRRFLPAGLVPKYFLFFEVLVSFCVAKRCPCRTLFQWLLSWTGVVFGPLLGHLETNFYVLLCWYSKQSEPLVEEWEICFSGAKQVFLRV